MRILGLALGVILSWTGPTLAYEIEEERYYPGTGPVVLRVISTADLAVFEPYLRAFQTQRPRHQHRLYRHLIDRSICRDP